MSVSPAAMVYWKTSVVVPEPLKRVAVLVVPPMLRLSVGAPVTVTGSSKVTVTLTTSPTFRVLF